MKLEIINISFFNRTNLWEGIEKYGVYLDNKLINQFNTKPEANAFCDRIIRKEKIKWIQRIK